MTMAILGAARLEGGQASHAPASPAPRRRRRHSPRAGRPAAEGRRSRRRAQGRLGGLLAGGAAGSVISRRARRPPRSSCSRTATATPPIPGSATARTRRFRRAISPSALGADQINSPASQSGLSRDELLQGLSQYLPEVVDHLTPDGRLPTDSEVSGRL